MSKHYLIVIGAVKDEERVQAYKQIAGPVMKEFGGVMPPENFEVTSTLAGSLNPSFLLRVEFPSLQNIKNAFESEQYKSVVSDRDEGFSNLSIFTVEGE